jgi:peptidoglycan/xylan/chitin deacetylase (PgdA/CDA1 family)
MAIPTANCISKELTIMNKQIVRRLAYRLAKGSGFLTARRMMRTRRNDNFATILVFHGVTPHSPEDGVTITPQRFGSILDLLLRSYRVVSLDNIAETVKSGRAFSGDEVAITFDDGYHNNYEFAVPLLLERNLPASFFLTAGFVNTRDRFWWDVEKGQYENAMTWAQAREIAELGFSIGCHTWSHPDLGTEPIGSSDREIREAREEIAERTGTRVQHFAYPYGGRANVTEEWIDKNKEEGFDTCSAAANGHVTRSSDLFRLERLGAAPQRSLEELQIDLDEPW